ncbi:hypothetical protein VP01_2781g1 [Puccinia sorghi]|uniref:Uncharacterized protein n=1 Tax=Puccinia sorghi TaxID=27349 RepID=A0A0L6V2R4_9BASI|nr:hypothetical protein VP01_2781g1 [Puccinia sorghi]
MHASMLAELQAGLAQRNHMIAQLHERKPKIPQQPHPNQLPRVKATLAPKKKQNTCEATHPFRHSCLCIKEKSTANDQERKSRRESKFSQYIGNIQEAFYVKIKFLWGLIKQQAVPEPPLQEQLSAFYQRFYSSEEIKFSAPGVPCLIAVKQIKTLKDAKDKWTKLAHRICTIKTFHQLVSGGAYKYMSINEAYVDDFDILKQTYNQYVHYVFAKVVATVVCYTKLRFLPTTSQHSGQSYSPKSW